MPKNQKFKYLKPDIFIGINDDDDDDKNRDKDYNDTLEYLQEIKTMLDDSSSKQKIKDKINLPLTLDNPDNTNSDKILTELNSIINEFITSN